MKEGKGTKHIAIGLRAKTIEFIKPFFVTSFFFFFVFFFSDVVVTNSEIINIKMKTMWLQIIYTNYKIFHFHLKVLFVDSLLLLLKPSVLWLCCCFLWIMRIRIGRMDGWAVVGLLFLTITTTNYIKMIFLI